MLCTFRYGAAQLREVGVRAERNDRTGKVVVKALRVSGRWMVPTKRFWTSLFVRFGFNQRMFRYFDHHEVFQRIAQRAPSDVLHYCVEVGAGGTERLLAVIGPRRSAIRPAELLELLGRYGAEQIRYHEGVVSSVHLPRSGDETVLIGGDGFAHRFMLETPVDGYGNPRLYLSLLREVCSNGIVAYSPIFRSEIRAGDEAAHSIRRALEAYDNGEGYAALRQRVQSAQTSWASIRECQRMYRTLSRAHGVGGLGPSVLTDFDRVTGDLHELYGVANLEAVSPKRQRVLPARCKVYDLLNFASELATHHAEAAGARVLQGHLGTLLSDEYDLEGTAEGAQDFQELFLSPAPGRRADAELN